MEKLEQIANLYPILFNFLFELESQSVFGMFIVVMFTWFCNLASRWLKKFNERNQGPLYYV